jgi:hypothetical protein
VHLTPPGASIISRNINEFGAGPDLAPDARVLHLGSGDVPAPDPRIISVDVLPTENVDVVAEAEALPFQTGSFDLVVSGAVFEHVFDPVGSAREARRVLKNGGRLRIDTAFLQSYHGYPGHYFNMTPQAVETFIVDDFILEYSGVPDSGTVLCSIVALFDRFLENLPAFQQRRLNAMPLKQALAEMRTDQTRGNPLLRDFPEHLHRAMAASFVVVARKPSDYDEGKHGGEGADTIRRDYYTARVAVMDRHAEVCFYAMRAKEFNAPDDEYPIPSLSDLLTIEVDMDLTNTWKCEEAIRTLTTRTATLTAMRDRWIGRYLRGKHSGTQKDSAGEPEAPTHPLSAGHAEQAERTQRGTFR